MTEKLTAIRDYLIAKYSQYHIGFANVVKPSGVDLTIDADGQYCGITDAKGNYFYLRSLRTSTFATGARGCRPTFYRRTTACRIVSLIEGVSDESHELVLIEAISRLGHAVQRSVIERTQVFFEETGAREITDGLRRFSLVSVDFEVVDLVNAKDCKLELCECQ